MWSRSLDQGPDVRMKDLGQAVIGAYSLDHGQPGGDVVPLALIGLEGGRPIGVNDDGSNEIGAARPLEEVGGLLSVALGLCPDARIVQDEGHETAHGAKGKPRRATPGSPGLVPR